jgi:opacity protein-like surface antigen
MRLLAMALVLLAAEPGFAADGASERYKFKVMLGAGYNVSSVDFPESQSFPLYQESATIDTTYSANKAAGVDVGLQWNALQHFGVQLAASRFSRELAGSFSASIPHPLYFDQPRKVSGDLIGTLSETAVHLSLVAFGTQGKLDLSGWAGISFFKVEADLLQGVNYSQSYPYDSITVTSTPTSSVSDSPIGFTAGASAEWRFAQHFGAGVQGRYAKATAKLKVNSGNDVEIDAGGLGVGAGIRIYF